MNFNVAVCDDELQLARNIARTIQSVSSGSKIEIFHSGEELLRTELVYDVVFLDIEMQGYDGMEVAKILWEREFEGQIVFLTSHRELIQDAFKVKAFRFLYKPIDKNQLKETFHAIEQECSDEKRVITILGDKLRTIKLNDIRYIEASRNITYIVTKSEQIECHKPFGEVYQMLDPAEFIRVHKSYLVALRYIRTMDDTSITMYDIAPQIPVSRRKKRQVIQAYMDYVSAHAIYL